MVVDDGNNLDYTGDQSASYETETPDGYQQRNS